MDTVDIEALIDEAQPAERSIPLCLKANLQARYEELETRLAQTSRATADSLAGGGGEAATIRADMEALRVEMIAGTVTVTMRALPRPKFQSLLKLHPPRQDDAGNIVPEDADGPGVNMATFWRALILACWAAPTVDKARMTRLLDEVLTSRQFERLGQIAFIANRGDVDIPFSLADSDRHPTSSPGSDSLGS